MRFIYIYFATNCQGLHTKLKFLFLTIFQNLFMVYFIFYFIQSLMVKVNSFTKEAKKSLFLSKLVCAHWPNTVSNIHLNIVVFLFHIFLVSAVILYLKYQFISILKWIGGLENFLKIFLLKSRNLNIGFIVYYSCYCTLHIIHTQSTFVKVVNIFCVWENVNTAVHRKY